MILFYEKNRFFDWLIGSQIQKKERFLTKIIGLSIANW